MRLVEPTETLGPDTPFEIVHDGETLQTFDTQPRLDTLRAASRELADPLTRLDLWDAPLYCAGDHGCGASITGRFGGGPDRHVLCWECACDLTQQGRAAVDPTKAVIGESQLHTKSLCDYVLNSATGCGYGCEFCYVKASPNIWGRTQMLEDYADVDDTENEWGQYLLYRDDAPERLVHEASSRTPSGWNEWQRTEEGRGIVGISFHTDAYQDRRVSQITRECIVELVNRGQHVRVLTRSPAVVRDRDLFSAAGEQVLIGSSIPTLNTAENEAIEPNSPPPHARLKALKTLSEHGVPVFVSMSPTYPTQDRDDIYELLSEFAELDTLRCVFHEPINPRGGNIDHLIEAARNHDVTELASGLAALKDRDNWVDYAVSQLKTVRDVGDELNVPVKLWPDKALLSACEGEREDFCQREFDRPSPETFARNPRSHEHLE